MVWTRDDHGEDNDGSEALPKQCYPPLIRVEGGPGAEDSPPTLAQPLFDMLLELLASQSLLAITSATTTVGLHLRVDRIQ